ncbi:MAG: UDP-N-acetylmuramoyl-L-alanyl-D-glutamate--2,6-diaminopimelate ligase, partial [Pyramidobacter sp.]|nr:UDP-N-acetylmuramoyl-L-alanyl-D-glutamate--2,6-diaminopimelate ligase [Pyramidobacter sp.]
DDCFSIVMPREAAIKAALDWCEPGDLLVLSGKGPEPYLEINGVKHPYSDKGAVENWMAEKGVRAL